ncbi:hypothetical protein [Methylomicrobium album]|uniref:hypothetical protein n=1 Tax=Methylomicrobium album TaxID=39775 RepID=UPI00020D80FD|nr:hypothetical protein [Methylomicrobium album]
MARYRPTGIGSKIIEALDLKTILIGSSVYGIGEHVEVHCNTIDALYPDFNKVFQHPFRDMRCSKTALATALESMKILKDSKNLLRVTLEWRNGNMQLIASNKDGEEISAEIACDGEPGSCTVNLAYLIDMIKSADEDLTIRYAGEHTPIIHR